MTRHLWKAIGFWKPPTISVPTIARLFSSHPADNQSLDPEKTKAEAKRDLDSCKLRCRTDPEWVRRRQRLDRESSARLRQSWSEEYREQHRKDARERQRKNYAENPRFRLSQGIYVLLIYSRWARECLPWKTHTPVYYDKKVEHSCSSCLVSRHGGARLWWKRHDGEQYKCFACYTKGPNLMPEGYEDCESVPELRKRSKELGHKPQRQ